MKTTHIPVRAAVIAMAAAALGSCSMAAMQPTRSADGQREFAQLIAGKVAGAPVRCLPRYDQDDMSVIDDSTIAYRQGSRSVFINHMEGGCPGLGRGSTALLTRSFGSSETCRGDIAQVIDTGNHMIVGSCVFGDFIPYSTVPQR